jgi:hypothetical protein
VSGAQLQQAHALIYGKPKNLNAAEIHCTRQSCPVEGGARINEVWGFTVYFVFTAAQVDKITGAQFTAALALITKFSHKWRVIGLGLGFAVSELDAIQSMPRLLTTAPLSWLTTMLTDWQQWTPEDARGSGQYPTLRSLRMAVDGAGFGHIAEELEKHNQSKLSSLV